MSKFLVNTQFAMDIRQFTVKYPVIYNRISGNLEPDIRYFGNGVSGILETGCPAGYLVMLSFAGYPVSGQITIRYISKADIQQEMKIIIDKGKARGRSLTRNKGANRKSKSLKIDKPTVILMTRKEKEIALNVGDISNHGQHRNFRAEESSGSITLTRSAYRT